MSINRRQENKDEGYQRALSSSRVEAVSRHIQAGKAVPTSVLVALEGAKYDPKSSTLSIPAGEDIGWVIDGQHRIAGAHVAAEAGTEIELSVIALLDQNIEFQIEQFITINREAKGVPTSLVYDLLRHLPPSKKPGDVANERAVEIADHVRNNSDSVFFGRIVVTASPVKGQISLTNWVRKVSPLVHPDKGLLNVYYFEEQVDIFENYFRALKQLFSEQWDKFDENIFFKTVGFGAILNVFDTVFKEVMQRSNGFRVQDIVAALKYVSHFDVAQWNNYGTGSKAELQAAEDFRLDFSRSIADLDDKKRIRLK